MYHTDKVAELYRATGTSAAESGPGEATNGQGPNPPEGLHET